MRIRFSFVKLDDFNHFSFPVYIYYMYFYMSHLINMLDTRDVTYCSSDGRRDSKVIV